VSKDVKVACLPRLEIENQPIFSLWLAGFCGLDQRSPPCTAETFVLSSLTCLKAKLDNYLSTKRGGGPKGESSE
jgi:hypothetical protein